MPQEIRKIFFSDQEAMDALVEYCVAIGIKLPGSKPERLQISLGNDIFVQLAFPDADAAPLFDHDQIGAALMFYAKNRAIPLPRAGLKSLKIQDDKLALVIQLGWSGSPAQATEPEVSGL